MRKVLLLVMVSLDGYFDAPGEGLEKIDWHRAGEEWEANAIELLSGADVLLFGRKTSKGFAQAQPDKDNVILGSADQAATLTQHGLIGEYRIAVNPVVLGEGTPLFWEGAGRLNLRLIDTRIFKAGMVELRYAPEQGAQA